MGHIWRTAHSVYVVRIGRSCKHFHAVKQKCRSPHNKTATKNNPGFRKLLEYQIKDFSSQKQQDVFPTGQKSCDFYHNFKVREWDLISDQISPWSNSKLSKFHRTDGKESSSDPRSEWSPLKLPSYCPDWPLYEWPELDQSNTCGFVLGLTGFLHLGALQTFCTSPK